jgi:hypothetical protein
MTAIDILIPFSIPPADHAKDLMHQFTSQCKDGCGLASLLTRHSALTRQRFDEFSHALPHESWLNDWLHAHGSSQLAQRARRCALDLAPGHWFVVNPVYLHIARNALVLTDTRQLTLSRHDAIALFEMAKTLCAQHGVELVFGDALTWFLRADHWTDLITASPDAACGHNIDIWLPKGANELAWRKLHNDIQMEWFHHFPSSPVNGCWLWSGTTLLTGFKSDSVTQLVHSPHPNDFFKHPPALTLIDALSSAALANDWGDWLVQMVELERCWFFPLYLALKQGRLDSVQLHLSHSTTLLSVHLTRRALYKFWRIPTLNSFMP